MRVFVAQLNPIVGDIKGNTAKVIQSIEQAIKQNAECILFPEMVLCGYPPQDLLLFPEFIHELAAALESVCAATKNIAAVVGTVRNVPHATGKKLYNSAAIIENQEILGFHDKLLLPTYDVFNEDRYFQAGDALQSWQIGSYRILVTICEDIWLDPQTQGMGPYPRDLFTQISSDSIDAIFNLSASPFSQEKAKNRETICSQLAKRCESPVFLCNQVGANDGLIFDGSSVVMDATGQTLARAQSFAEQSFCVDTSQAPSLSTPLSSTSQLFKALSLGIADYFAKQNFSRACLGLSGGIDSALVACLAADALGPENVLGVAMPSRYSSTGSVNDAEQLAHALGIAYQKIPIEEMFSSSLQTLVPFFDDKESDTTEENLQARIRGTILMALSNKHGYIVLSTGNKSELALGYCTLYGDMCGGLAVLSDVTKNEVYELSRWINHDKEIIPGSTLTKAPSAELRPDQKDSDSLPDYSIIDTVLKAYVERHLSPREIAEREGLDLSLVTKLVQKIHNNEYKRQQAPIGLRVSERSFNLGRHFPIVERWLV